MLLRKTVALALCLILLASCGGRQEVYEVPPGVQAEPISGELTLPEPVPAVPVFVIESPKELSTDQIRSLRKTPGAAVVAPASVRMLRARSKGRVEELRAAAVDPLEFRSVAPGPTREADFVWLALLTGEGVLSHDAAKKLGPRSQERVVLEGGMEIDVGAVADNGTPNFVDVLIGSDSVGASWGPRRLAVVGAETGTTLESLRRDLAERVPGARIKRIVAQSQVVAPAPQVAAPPTVSSSAAGLHPAMAEAVSALLSAANGRVWVVSGYRSTARQYELWIQALQKYKDPEVANNWVAPPGHSMHERGLAVDLGGDLEYAASLVQELQLPLWRPMSWEPWHFELVGSRG